ncbi:MAG: hypothetical protein R2864_10040 [Syntrophotaleaceae bacterium]
MRQCSRQGGEPTDRNHRNASCQVEGIRYDRRNSSIAAFTCRAGRRVPDGVLNARGMSMEGCQSTLL